MLRTGKMLELKISDFSKAKLNFSCSYKQAGAELCQAQVSYAVEFDGLDKLYNLN